MPGATAWPYRVLSAALAAMDSADAPAAITEALRVTRDSRQWRDVREIEHSIALWWARRGKLEPACVLFGSFESAGFRPASAGTPRAEADAIIAQHPDAAALKARGAAMDRDELVDFVLAELEKMAAEPETPAPD
jgi:hypothetical protein